MTRETKIPITRIKKLVKMKQDLDDEVRNIMEKYNVDMSYVRGLLKAPSKEPISKKKTTTNPIKKQKKYIDRSDLIE